MSIRIPTEKQTQQKSVFALKFSMKLVIVASMMRMNFLVLVCVVSLPLIHAELTWRELRRIQMLSRAF